MAVTTNQEYIGAKLGRFNLSDDDVEVIILESGITGTASVDVAACKNAIYESLSTILPVANVSESGFSLSWDFDGLRLWYNALCKELKKPNKLGAEVRNRSNLW